MEFFLDLTWLENLGQEHPFIIMWRLFIHGGWALILITLLWGAWQCWFFWIKEKYDAKRKFCLLAVDVPKGNEQTPKAVEHIFSHLAGTLSKGTLWERYGLGKTQECFSLEIISIDGYIQFLVRVNEVLRDLIEAAVYAQYPDAEITEVDDYTVNAPLKFPDSEYTLWGTEFVLARPEVYPIRTYPEFEHPMAEEKFKDPMAALLEVLSKLQKGEQVWIQWIITPINDQWREKGEVIARKLAGKKVEVKKSILDNIIDAPMKILGIASDIILSSAAAPTIKREEPPSMMLHLTPGERKTLEGIQQKTSKIGFKTKFRLIYISPHEKYSKPRGVAPVVGAIKQFNTLDMNSFKPVRKITTDTYYITPKKRTAVRQNKIIKAFRVRSNGRGWGNGSVLNIEELASLWHFPVLTVKAPLLKKTEAKKAEPPFTLPLEEIASEEIISPLTPPKPPKPLIKFPPEPEIIKETFSSPEPVERKAEPPANLPTV